MDIHTLHIEHAVLLALYTLLTIANSWLYRGMKEIHWFALYNLFALLGATSVALRGQIPGFLSIVVGNLFVVAAYAILFLSIADFTRRRTSQIYLHCALFLVAVITMLEYGWLHPNTGTRLIAYSAVLCIQQAHIATVLYRNHEHAIRIPTASMSLMLAALALTNLVRIIGVWILGAPANYLDANSFLSWIVIVTSCLQGGIIVAYVWMTAAILRRDLEVQASTDPLTGLLNRRALERAAEQRIIDSQRDGTPISAMILDLDEFKHVNDSFGHHCGDATLIAIARCLQRNMRPLDLLARIGGDEFAILLCHTAHGEALRFSHQIRSSIAATVISHSGNQIRVTTSIGLAQLQPPALRWEDLFMSCDKLLYEEKRASKTLPTATTGPGSELNFLTN